MRTALANVENLSAGAARTATAHAAHKEEPQCGKEQNWNQPCKCLAPVVGFVLVLHADFAKVGILGVKTLHCAVKRFRRHFKHVVRTLIGRVANRRFGQFFVLFDGRQRVGLDEDVDFFAVDHLDAIDVAALNASAQLVEVRGLGLGSELALRKLKPEQSDKDRDVNPAKVEFGETAFG